MKLAVLMLSALAAFSQTNVNGVSGIFGTAPSPIGPDLIVNGGFVGNASGWTLGSDVVYGNNNVVSTYAGGDPSITSTAFTTVVGHNYRLSWTMSAANAPAYYYNASGPALACCMVTTNGAYTFVFVAKATSTAIVFDDFNYATGDTWTLANVSVHEVATPSDPITAAYFYGMSPNVTALALNFNVAAGINTLLANTTGMDNSAFGSQVLFSNTSGHDNVGIGFTTLFSNTTGTANMAFGSQALFSNTTGNANSAVGSNALYNNTTGSSNQAIGQNALFQNTAGGFNAAIGLNAGKSNSTGVGNVAVGALSMFSNTTGNYNTAIGYGSGGVGTNGVFIGANAIASVADLTNAIAIGSGAQVATSNTVVLGGADVTDVFLGMGGVAMVHAGGGSANTVVCWKSDGVTLGFATVAEITAGTCH